MVHMDHLPVFLKVRDRRCLVVGGGAVAARKVRLLLRAGAVVTVVAPDLSPELAALRDSGSIVHIAAEFADRLVDGMRLVIAATHKDAVNRRIARAAEAAGVLCNVVDDGAASGFIVPAIVDRSPVVIAVSTGGNAPVLARLLKSRIEAWLPSRIGDLAKQAGRWRGLVARRFRESGERRRFWQRLFGGPIAEHLLANRRRQAERELRLELIDNVVPQRKSGGQAFIVGAGPGDPGLMTIRGQQLLSEADVVLHDRLVSPQILDFARKDAELVCVGKSAEYASSAAGSVTQEQINALLLSHVRDGRRVCRLKGGDPFVFGRGGEEIRALANAGLPFEVVPGISAALGCAAYAGIPLTQRGIASRVTFATATLDGERDADWGALAQSDQTLVLYMGVASLGITMQRLIAGGLAGATPVAIVENGTTGRQRVLRGTLATISGIAAAAGVSAPATIFVGPTAGLGAELQWFAGDPDGAEQSATAFPPRRDWPEPGAAGRSGNF